MRSKVTYEAKSTEILSDTFKIRVTGLNVYNRIIKNTPATEKEEN